MVNNINNMMALDLYASSLSKSNFERLYPKINHNAILPLMSWDLFAEANFKRLSVAKQSQDIVNVKHLADQFHWDNNLDTIFDDAQFEAILITDLQQKILWVNKGFSKMTGFSKREALDKTPQFLQGPETLPTSKQSIKKQLNANSPFKEVIVNYKKNGTPYKCEVNIFPLYKNGYKTHFMALEREVV